jgi:integrase
MASIHPYLTKTSKQRYLVAFIKPDGKPTTKRGFTGKREAQKFIDSLAVSFASGTFIPHREKELLERTKRNPDGTLNGYSTVLDWVEANAQNMSRSATTRERIEGIVEVYIRGKEVVDVNGKETVIHPRSWIADIAIKDLERQHVRRWIAELQAIHTTRGKNPNAPLSEQSLSASTIHKIVGVLSGSLALAVEDGYREGNPAVKSDLPPIVKQKRKYLTHEQVIRLAEEVEAINAAKSKSAQALGYGTLIYTLAYAGLRFGELAALTVEDINFETRTILVDKAVAKTLKGQVGGTTKTGNWRWVPMNATLSRLLKAQVAGKSAHELVFTGARSSTWIWNHAFRLGWFNEAAALIGVPGLTPHEMRHTYASLSVAAGANIKQLSYALGHASAAMTLNVYSDLYPEDNAAVANKLDAAIEVAQQKRQESAEKGDEKAA